MILYHYTSLPAYGEILRDGKLLTFPQVLLGGRPAVWFTDTPVRERRSVKARRAIGVDHEMYGEDRTARELLVPVDHTRDAIFLWSSVSYEYPGAYALTEGPLGARPDTWWLAFEPMPVVPPPHALSEDS